MVMCIGKNHEDTCYSSFVNLIDFVHTEILASQFSPWDYYLS